MCPNLARQCDSASAMIVSSSDSCTQKDGEWQHFSLLHHVSFCKGQWWWRWWWRNSCWIQGWQHPFAPLLISRWQIDVFCTRTLVLSKCGTRIKCWQRWATQWQKLKPIWQSAQMKFLSCARWVKVCWHSTCRHSDHATKRLKMPSRSFQETKNWLSKTNIICACHKRRKVTSKQVQMTRLAIWWTNQLSPLPQSPLERKSAAKLNGRKVNKTNRDEHETKHIDPNFVVRANVFVEQLFIVLLGHCACSADKCWSIITKLWKHLCSSKPIWKNNLWIDVHLTNLCHQMSHKEWTSCLSTHKGGASKWDQWETCPHSARRKKMEWCQFQFQWSNVGARCATLHDSDTQHQNDTIHLTAS